MLGGILSRLIILKVTEIQTIKLTSVNVEKLNFVWALSNLEFSDQIRSEIRKGIFSRIKTTNPTSAKKEERKQKANLISAKFEK